MKTVMIVIALIIASSAARAAEYGTFMLVKGKVQIESDKMQISDAKVGGKIFAGESVITAADSRAKIVMSDRNIINILPNTKLKIDKYINTAKGKDVKLSLIEGRVRNNVEQKYDGKNDKFEVRTPTAVAGVRGTQFVTGYNSTTGISEVITFSGEVFFQSIRTDSANPETIGAEVIVKRGEKSEVGANKEATAPVKVPPSELKQIEREANATRRGSGKQLDKDGNIEEVVGGINNSPIEVRNPLQQPITPTNPTGTKTKVKIEIK